MKALQELYAEIIGNDELKKAYLEAAKGGRVAEFLKAQGCETTAEEIGAFLKEKAQGQLSDAELDSVAGGVCNDTTREETVMSVLTAGTYCFTIAVVSAREGYTGQRYDNEGRLCNQE